MNDEQLSIAARLTLHEFLLEIFHANLFASAPNPRAELEAFRAEVLDLIRYKSRTSDIDNASGLRLQQEVSDIAEKFLAK